MPSSADMADRVASGHPPAPAPWGRRAAAAALDVGALLAVLGPIALVLPDGPPPVDAMAFFSMQDFASYFLLVVVAMALARVAFARAASTGTFATPGQRALGLAVRALDGGPPSPAQWRARGRRALWRIAFIALPGPLIALFVLAITSQLLTLAMSTPDQVLRDAGAPTAVRIGLHSLSFIALAAALWWAVIRPGLRARERDADGLTAFDRKTQSTVVQVGGGR